MTPETSAMLLGKLGGDAPSPRAVQRKRPRELYVARALLQRADVVVLDESFAALDPENLQRVLRCVLRRAPTLLVIAHP